MVWERRSFLREGEAVWTKLQAIRTIKSGALALE
jgi:hypothetical protein